MIRYVTHGYVTIACIFQMLSSTLCGLLLITFYSHNGQPVRDAITISQCFFNLYLKGWGEGGKGSLGCFLI